MSVPDTLIRRARALTLAVSGGLLALGGCTLFSTNDLTKQLTASRSVLPPIKAPVDAVQLQVIFIERPADDPLIRNLIWQDLDQVGAMAPETRTVLDQNGIRVGQSGSHPPPSLQKLLGMTEELVAEGDADHQLMRGRRLGLRSAQESEIQTLDQPLDTSIRYVLDGQEDTVPYEQLRPVLKIRPVRVQDGWIRLEFSPEMHHGQSRLRHTPTDEGWALRGGQECDARYLLKFHVMLNNGELAVISCDASKPDSVGSRMFTRKNEGRQTQRLLVVRLADSGRADLDPMAD